jgi:hypothetical protein
MNYNFLITGFIIICCLFYIKFTETFFRFCRSNQFYHNKENFNHTNHKHPFDKLMEENLLIKMENFEKLCNDTSIDYKTHFIMKHSIDKINSFTLKLDMLNENEYCDYVKSTDITNLKLSLLLLKFIYISLYVMILYIGILIIPNYIAQLAISLFNKILFLCFIIFLCEAVLKIYFNLDTDLITYFDKKLYLKYVDYLPFETIYKIFKYISQLIKQLL